MERFSRVLVSAALVMASLVNVFIPTLTTVAASPTGQAQEGINQINPEGPGGGVDLTTRVQQILQTIFLVVGIIAVVVIIIGGINYTMSQGDPGKVKKAKDTILYGIIGLVVTLSAFAITQFVMNALK